MVEDEPTVSNSCNELHEQLVYLTERLNRIEERNRRVELDKAWELSFCRIALITMITYGLCVAVFLMLGSEAFYLNAIVPTLGFILSIQTIPIVKKIWISGKTGAAHSSSPR